MGFLWSNMTDAFGLLYILVLYYKMHLVRWKKLNHYRNSKERCRLKKILLLLLLSHKKTFLF